jgi:hypothetical protein
VKFLKNAFHSERPQQLTRVLSFLLNLFSLKKILFYEAARRWKFARGNNFSNHIPPTSFSISASGWTARS